MRKGEFKHKVWSPENMNDGYLLRGRMRVYLPNHHRASANGYVTRAILHYEYYHNDIVTKEFAIHHIDGNTVNDSKENLVKMTVEEHTRFHRQKDKIKCVCLFCGTVFFKDGWRLNESGRTRGRYCSHDCYKRSRCLKENRDAVKQRVKRAIRNATGQIIAYRSLGETSCQNQTTLQL